MFIGAYAYGYNKGMQDYLLGNKKDKENKTQNYK